MVYTPTKSVLENETHRIFWIFGLKIDHLILAGRLSLELIFKKVLLSRRFCHSIADDRVKIKERGKIDEYLDLARELEKLWNMVIPIAVGALGTIPQSLGEKI